MCLKEPKSAKKDCVGAESEWKNNFGNNKKGCKLLGGSLNWKKNQYILKDR